MLTVYTLSYNEEYLIQFMIDHYRERFPGCKIVLSDNMSIDNTVKIATKNGCDVRFFDTNNLYKERTQVQIRNTIWKDASTDWVLVCDIDELLDINAEELQKEESFGTTIIRTKTYDMINMNDDCDINKISYGVLSEEPGKRLLFNKKFINEMNFGPGSHILRPIGVVAYSLDSYNLYHYNSLGIDLTIKKFKQRAQRMSVDNALNSWGIHYLMTPRQIRDEYSEERKKAIKIR